MSREREAHERLSQLFDCAVDLDSEAQEALLARLERSDPELAGRLATLLRLAVQRQPFDAQLSIPVEPFPFAAAEGAQFDPNAKSKAEIGPYRVLRRLDSGGLHEVYAARRIQPPHEEVAIKVMPNARISAEARWRFASECAALASVSHPNVAQIHDVGTTPCGRPWIAVELVDGLDLASHCRANRLDPAAIVDLMTTVCDAIQAMHQQGVLHRDLKPTNILVRRDVVGGIPRDMPKLIDFGMARIDGAEGSSTEGPGAAAARPLRTATGQLLGTLPYMSPEALRGDPRAVDLRTDIYSLGVILFELLAGQRPFDLSTLPVPQRLGPGAQPPDLGAVMPSCRGDLARVVGKAMAFDRVRRYASASELATDLRHWRRHEPVAARPASLTHSAILLLRRRPAASLAAAMAAVLALLVAFLLIGDARRSRAELAKTQDMLSFAVAELLPVVENAPGAAPAQDKVLQFVIGATEAEKRFSDDPVMRWLRARALLRQTYRDRPADRAVSELRLAEALAILDELDQLGEGDRARSPRGEGIPAATTPTQLQRDLFRATLLVRQGNLADERGEVDREAALQRAAGTLLAEVAARHPSEPAVWSQLVFVHEKDGNRAMMRRAFEKAAADFDQMEDALDRLQAYAPDHPSLLHGRMLLALHRGGLALYRGDAARGDLAAASAEYERAIALARPLHARGTIDRRVRENLLRAFAALASVRAQQGQPHEALDLLQEALPHAEWFYHVDAGGPSRALILGDIHEQMGRVLLHMNEPAQALEQLDRARELLASTEGEATELPFDASRLAATEAFRHDALRQLGRADEAAQARRTMCDLHRQAVRARPTARAFISLALALSSSEHATQQDVQEALDAARRAVEMESSNAAAWEAMFCALSRAGRPEEAKEAASRALSLAADDESVVCRRVRDALKEIESDSAAR